MKKQKHIQAGFEKLWAPWRMKYIDAINTTSDDACIFCEKPREHKDKKNFIVYRGKTCYAILNRFPYNNGHLLIVPYQHTCELSELNTSARLEFLEIAQKAMDAMKMTLRTDGFNLGINFGRSAGAGIAGHLHLHLVPRWNGDTNFMPVVGSTKVISESLEDTYVKLKKSLRKMVK
jgi:ATP adenylyltransferase